MTISTPKLDSVPPVLEQDSLADDLRASTETSWEAATARLRATRGRYVWGVRTGDGALLSWEAGEPSLHVEMARSDAGVEVRTVRPRGRWQVAILEGDIQLTAGGYRIDLGTDPRKREALDCFEGQALIGFAFHAGALTLRFDLDAVIEVSQPRLAVADGERVVEWRGESAGRPHHDSAG